MRPPQTYRWKYLRPCVGMDYPTQLEDIEGFRRMGFANIKVVQPMAFIREVLGVTAPIKSRVYAFLQGPVWSKLRNRLAAR